MKKSTAALIAALLIGATGAPRTATAQSFGIFFGDEPEDFFPGRIICMTNGQIRQAVADQGYTDVALNVPNEGQIQVRATRDGYVYLLDFDYCRGRIEGRQRLRPAG
jgi:hypothetical protein